MYKTHFAQAQYNREKIYVVLTKLINKDSKMFITKESIFPEGKDHIEAIFKNYKLLSESSHKFLLPKTQLKNNKLWIEYIEGVNIESQIEELLFKGNITEANRIVAEVIEFLESFPVVQENPYDYPDFVAQFDPKEIHLEQKTIACIKPGLHDINFDNIIKKGKEYYFVDYEWCFDYPLPKEYLLLRTIFYLSLKLNRRIQSIASPEFECFNFFHDIYVPVEWLKSIPHTAQTLQKMIDYEYNLLSSIFIFYPKLEKIKKNYKKKIINTPKTVPGDSISSLNNRIKDDQKEITELRSQLISNNRTIDSLQKLLKSKEDVITSYYNHIEELREVNRKYQSKSFLILERLERSKIAQIKPLRIILRKTLSLVMKIIRVD